MDYTIKSELDGFYSLQDDNGETVLMLHADHLSNEELFFEYEIKDYMVLLYETIQEEDI